MTGLITRTLAGSNIPREARMDSLGRRQIFVDAVAKAPSEDDVLDLCRKHVLHGTPYLFAGREDDHYSFRKRIAHKFNISFHEVYITGSAKLGFSVLENKAFDLDSDVDVALVSQPLFDRLMESINTYQMSLREARRTVTERELAMYHSFLEYTAIGWLRPDKLPHSFDVKAMKDDWFDFFKSLSYGGSEVGDYKVAAGVFRQYRDLENYQYRGLLRLRSTQRVKAAS